MVNLYFKKHPVLCVIGLNLVFILICFFTQKVFGAMLLSWLLGMIVRVPRDVEVIKFQYGFLVYAAFIINSIVCFLVARDRQITYENGITTEENSVIVFFVMIIVTSFFIEMFLRLKLKL